MHWQRLKRFILKIRNVACCTDFVCVCVCSKSNVGRMRNCRMQKKHIYKILSSFFYAATEFRSFSLKILDVCVVLHLGR